MHLGGPVREQPDARGAVVVEALGEADVLEADREPRPAPHTFAPRGVARAARKPERVPRQRLRLGRLERGGAADHLGGRERALHPLARRERVAGRQGVREAQVDRIDPERGRELVHLGLGREAGLDGAEPAHRATRRVVRVDDGRLEMGIRNGVGPACERRGVGADSGRAGGVGPSVEQDPHLDVDDPALPRRGVPRPDLRRVAMDVTGERLLAVVDDLDGAARVQCEQRRVDLHRNVLSSAEGAADAGEVDADALGGKAETRRDLRTIDVKPLGGDVKVDPALAVRDRKPRLGAEKGLILDPGLVEALDAHLAGGTGRPWRMTIVRTTLGRGSSR